MILPRPRGYLAGPPGSDAAWLALCPGLAPRIDRIACGHSRHSLIDRADRELPAFTAGAHLDVEVPGGFVRQYSLCNSPSDRRRYEIAVLDVEDGRGGSRAMHTQVRGGDTRWGSAPRNDFALHEGARHHLLVAGGIGITPIMSMVERPAAARPSGPGERGRSPGWRCPRPARPAPPGP
jgi:hypothetical protein